ncbi:hypothetical protein D3C79_915130 [compost metagenome]
MGKAQLQDIRHQALGQFAPVVKTRHFAVVVQLALPGASVQLVDRQRRMGGLALATLLHPVLVLPVVGQGTCDPRGGAWRQFRSASQRVGLERQDAFAPEHFILVSFAGLQARHEQLPDPGRVAQAHGVSAPVPIVEITHHRHPPGIRRPH